MAEAGRGLRREILHQPARSGELLRRRIWREQHGHRDIRRGKIITPQSAENFVLGTIASGPTHVAKLRQFTQPHSAGPRDEGVFRHVTNQSHATLFEFRAPRGLHRTIELEDEQPGVRGFVGRGLCRAGQRRGFVRRGDGLVAQMDGGRGRKSQRTGQQERQDQNQLAHTFKESGYHVASLAEM